MEVKTFFAQRLNGDVIANPTVYLYQPDTVTLVAGLQDKNGGSIPNPFLGTGLGEICFAAPSGQYDMRIVGAGRDFTTRVHFLDVSDAVNAAVQVIQIQGQVYVAEAEQARDDAFVARDEAEAFAAQLGNVMLNDLGDVDVQTNPPLDADALVYESASSRWVPAPVVRRNNKNIYTKAQVITWVDLTAAPNVTPANDQTNFRLVLTENVILTNISGLSDGQILNFKFKQDNVGSKTLTFGNMYKFLGGAPSVSTAANSIDFMGCIYDATDNILICSYSPGAV